MVPCLWHGIYPKDIIQLYRMKEIKLQTTIRLAQSEELSEEDRLLVQRAIEATASSYSPYSHFAVGAALRLTDGTIVIGSNQENAAFPSGLCAERTAIFAAGATHPDQAVTTLAIAARNEAGLTAEPASPCGACRQVILEVEQRYKCPVRILLYGTNGVYIINSVRELLPLCFVDESMR
ncbi:MAG: cytidine deaminase [Prevotella sp.]